MSVVAGNQGSAIGGSIGHPGVVFERIAARIFVGAGVPADIAAVVAEDLVEANLSGHDSHGVMRIPQYLQQMRNGMIRPDAYPVIETEVGATALVSGEWGLGQVGGRFALNEAVTRAKGHGVAAVGLRRCGHLGRLGAFMERGAAAGCVTMMWAGGIHGTVQAVPFGGAKGVYGTNPFAAGFPVAGANPVVLDFATTAAAEGKIRVARDSGKVVPPGFIVDKNGQPSTDPNDLYAGGSLLPFGGHKGYGLAVLVELLSLALVGSDATGDEDMGGPLKRAGALIVAIKADAFGASGVVGHVAGTVVEKICATPPAPGFDRVMMPGEPEARTRTERTASGVFIPGATWTAILEAAASVGVTDGEVDAMIVEGGT